MGGLKATEFGQIKSIECHLIIGECCVLSVSWFMNNLEMMRIRTINPCKLIPFPCDKKQNESDNVPNVMRRKWRKPH